MKVSAYLSVFDDWNLLKPSIWSIENYVDDIIIVDGAYKWMAPYFNATGRNPSKSRDEVYDVLASFGRRVRVVNGTWENESEKRQAGYEACRGRYAIRTDADEIVFWNNEAVDRFLKSSSAVGQMQMPIYVAPGLIRCKDGDTSIEQQAFFFDRDVISSHDHLSYLWLVLPPTEQARLAPKDTTLIYHEPLAFTAHLTHWRAPETSISRARFYVMNYVRSTGGLPWLKNFEYTGDSSFLEFIKQVPAAAFDDILSGHPIVACPPDLRGFVAKPSPRSHDEERVFAMLYDNMIWGLGRLNESLSVRPRTVVTGQLFYFDVSSRANLASLITDTSLSVNVSHSVKAAVLTLTTLNPDGKVVSEELKADVDNTSIIADLTPMLAARTPFLRRSLALSIWCTDNPMLIEISTKR